MAMHRMGKIMSDETEITDIEKTAVKEHADESSPPCSKCKSEETEPSNHPDQGKFFCMGCREYFDPSSLPVIDKREEDVKQIIAEKRQAELELERNRDGLNVALMILSGLYMQPFANKRYLSNNEIDHVNYVLANLMAPIARACADQRNDTELFKSILTRLSVMCLNYFLHHRQIATSASVIEFGEAKYHIREENAIPYSVQVEPEIPKTKYDDQSLYQLLDAIEQAGKEKHKQTPAQEEKPDDGTEGTKRESEGETDESGSAAES